MSDVLLKQKNLKSKITDEIATRKRALNFYTLANILPDPDIVLRKQGKDITIYKELLCDSHVYACVQSRKSGVECFRLQGFPDEMYEVGKKLKLTDSHLYKMAGNAVTVNVIEAVARKLAEVVNDST